MHDIFTIERRIDLNKEVERTHLFLSRNYYNGGYRNFLDFYDAINEEFHLYEFRLTANTIYEYLQDLGIDFSKSMFNIRKMNDFDCLNYLQTIANLLHFSESTTNKFYSEDTYLPWIHEHYSQVTANIKLILDMINYTYYVEGKRVRFLKRDSSADSVIHAISDSTIMQDLLSYLDFRTQQNLTEKKSIIYRLYTYFERPENEAFAGFSVKSSKDKKDIKLSNDFKLICNEFDIRHFPEKVHKKTGLRELPEGEVSKLCDIAFYLFLEMFRIPTISNYHDIVESYKVKYRLKDAKE